MEKKNAVLEKKYADLEKKYNKQKELIPVISSGYKDFDKMQDETKRKIVKVRNN